jgi:hypothetical protein
MLGFGGGSGANTRVGVYAVVEGGVRALKAYTNLFFKNLENNIYIYIYIYILFLYKKKFTIEDTSGDPVFIIL